MQPPEQIKKIYFLKKGGIYMNNIDKDFQIEKKYNLCVENCNGILTRLYNDRDKIGELIDKLINHGFDTTPAEAEYDDICEDIRLICNWRNNHPDCLLEGDPGFRWN